MDISIIIISLILAGFFSGMEIAFVSSNKIYLEIEKKQQSFLSQILAKLTEKPSKFIAAMLVGYNLALVVYGYYMSALVMSWISGSNFNHISNILLQTAIATIILLLTAGYLPRVLFRIYANSMMRYLVFPAYIFYFIFYYLSSFILWISESVLRRIFGSNSDPVELFFSKVELGNYITEQMSTVENHEEVDSEIQMFQNALEFSRVKAREIMTPRTEISAIDIFAPISELQQLFIETGYSKILVYQDSLDDIIGYVHSFELFRKPRNIKSVMIPVEFVPQTIYIKDLMDQLTKKRRSIALVLDEYGGTAGIITIEDIVEELFGEIEDEHDQQELLTEEKLDDKTYLFSTRFDVAYLNETYALAIPESDSYSTLGGYIVDFTTEIPLKGAKITIGNFVFTIMECSNKKIELVKMAIGN